MQPMARGNQDAIMKLLAQLGLMPGGGLPSGAGGGLPPELMALMAKDGPPEEGAEQMMPHGMMGMGPAGDEREPPAGGSSALMAAGARRRSFMRGPRKPAGKAPKGSPPKPPGRK